MIQIYKPNAKNTGYGFSFQLGKDKYSYSLYINAIAQSSYDKQKRQGYFEGNKDNPDKNISVKFNEFELGEMIFALTKKSEWSTMHKFAKGGGENDMTQIYIGKYERTDQKTQKKSLENTLSFIRNGNQKFGITLNDGERTCLIEFFRFCLAKIYSTRFIKNQEAFDKKEYTKN